MAHFFRDREEAGERLAEVLAEMAEPPAVVLALPRGGVPVGAVIARRLGLALDVLLVRKVGAPMQPELAVGAVSDGQGMQVTVNEAIAAELGLGRGQIEELARRELPELERRRKLYLDGRDPVPLAGRTAIVVDDGVATGATVRSALRLVRGRAPRRLVLALPVAPPDVLAELEKEADTVVCLHAPTPFHAVGAHYAFFPQLDDGEVVSLLSGARKGASFPGDANTPGS